MTFPRINIGTNANDGTGDSLRAAAIKINQVLAVLEADGAGQFVNKSSAFTAEAFGSYRCDTTGAAFTVTLPESPEEGDVVTLVDDGGDFSGNPLTVDPGAEAYKGTVDTFSFSSDWEYVRLVFVGGTAGWLQA